MAQKQEPCIEKRRKVNYAEATITKAKTPEEQ